MNRVLVVDDQDMFRDVLVTFLKYKGYDIIEADDGPVALDRFEQSNPDMVLLDIYMPGMDGLDVLQQMKQRKPDTSVIMLTGANDDEIGREAMRLGAIDYITKPFDFDHLAEQIDTNLSVRFLLQTVE